jgi:hypothetical protein
MSPLRLGIKTRQTLTKLRVSAGAEEKHSTLAPSSSCVCSVCEGNDEPGIPAGRKHWLFHHDDFEWRRSSCSLSSLLFFPSAEERMCWYTPHRHSRTKGTNNSYRVKDAITLFEKVRVLVATVRPPVHSLSRSRTIELSVWPLKPKCFSAVSLLSNLLSLWFHALLCANSVWKIY